MEQHPDFQEQLELDAEKLADVSCEYEKQNGGDNSAEYPNAYFKVDWIQPGEEIIITKFSLIDICPPEYYQGCPGEASPEGKEYHVCIPLPWDDNGEVLYETMIDKLYSQVV